MAFPSDIQHEIDRQVQKVRDPSPTRPRTERAWAAAYIRKYGLKIEHLALGDEPPEALRARLDAALAAQAPATPTAVALIEQATVARIEMERLYRIRATLRASAIRTAEIEFQHRREDEVRYYLQRFNQDPDACLAGLKRSAAGLRHLISRWKHLSKCLDEESTWYGVERCEAILMQGHAAGFDQLFLSETAWNTWMDCLAAQPIIQQVNIDMMCAPDIVPQAIQDRGQPLWQPDPEASRARLRAIVNRELPALIALEAEAHVTYEEPARAAARDWALARFERDNRHLLDSLRRQERSLIEADRALAKHRAGTGSPSQKTRTGVHS
jgi:hypothetical protein